MQTVIWAFGSMLVLLLILTFLPLGLSIKGTAGIALSSFVLALVGLAAVSAFSLWVTGLMLIVLSFFTAFILDGRMGSSLFKENQLGAKEMMEMIDDNDDSIHEGNLLNRDTRLEIEKKDLSLSPMDHSKMNVNSSYIPAQMAVPQEHEQVSDILEEDISFLTDRKDGQEEKSNYLVDENLEEESVSDKVGWLEELSKLSMNDQEDTLSPLKVHDESQFAAKEVAAGKELNEQEPSNNDPKVMLY